MIFTNRVVSNSGMIKKNNKPPLRDRWDESNAVTNEVLKGQV
jgi:hypothetical protein